MATPAGFEPATFSLEDCCSSRSLPFFPQHKKKAIAWLYGMLYGNETAVKFSPQYAG